MEKNGERMLGKGLSASKFWQYQKLRPSDIRHNELRRLGVYGRVRSYSCIRKEE